MATFATPHAHPADIRLMNALASVMLTLVVLGAVAAAALWVARRPMFAIHRIEVDGDLSRNNVHTIRANAMPKLHGSFFTLNLAQAKAAFESVPWVRRATVQRVWPDTLRVQLVEHQPAALWRGEDGADRLVNTEGEVFEANTGDVEDDGLPTLAGPDGSSPRVLGLYRRLQPVFEQRLDAAIGTLEMSGRGSWRVELDNDAVVELGRGDDDEVVQRTDRFARTVPEVTGRYERRFVSADLRHHDGYAVRLRGVVTTPDAKPGTTPRNTTPAKKQH
jgi:cell division protein FtsQ